MSNLLQSGKQSRILPALFRLFSGVTELSREQRIRIPTNSFRRTQRVQKRVIDPERAIHIMESSALERRPAARRLAVRFANPQWADHLSRQSWRGRSNPRRPG